MGGAVVSRLIVLVGGTLYPAYASYKAVKSANVRQYVRWMMYWVVFAIFTTVETFTDIFFSWAPFYYEIKVGFIIWLLSPYTKGAAFLYRKFIHPMLAKREPEIDRFLMSAKERSYATMLDVGSKGINVAASAVVTAAVKGQAVVSDRLKSFSVNDLSRLSDDTPIHRMNDPSMYNPPLQREIMRRTPDTPRFELAGHLMQRSTSHQGAEQVPTEFLPPTSAMLPSSGQMMHPMGTVPSSEDNYLGSQYKAYSMMNLSQRPQQEAAPTRTLDEFDSTPPTASVDDSVIPDSIEHPADDRSYSTLPRQRKHKKHKKDKEPSTSPAVRRSKRKTKALSYHDSDDFEHLE